MKIRILLPCLACLLLATGCKFSYKYESNRSTSAINGNELRSEFVNNNGRIHCSYAFKTSEVEYKVASNGRITIKNGALKNLRHGQTVDITTTESGKEYRYQISNHLTGTETTSSQGPLTPTDEERIQRALKAIKKPGSQAARHAEESAMQEQARKQAEAVQRQAAQIEQQAQKQAEALQKQAEAMQKQAEAMQKQAEEFQRQLSGPR